MSRIISWKKPAAGRRSARTRIKSALCAVLLVLSLLVSGRQPVQAAQAKTLSPAVDEVLTKVRAYMLKVDTNPDYSSAWNAFGIARSGLGLPADYRDVFYNNTIYELKSKKWDYKTNRYSDYSRLILAMTAIGVDASDVDGHNLLYYLSDFKKIKKQGFNGPIWALIALKSHPSYKIPENPDAGEQTTEEGLIQYLINNGGTTAGGWTLYGDTPDSDITSMTLQALAPYYHEREDVRVRVDKALSWLASTQLSSGGFATLNGSGTVETSESAAQVVTALTALGIDPARDSRFITSSGKWPMSRLFEYVKSSGGSYGFMHVEAGGGNNGGGAAGSIDGMATEQGMYATAAYKRFLTGKTSLYDMSDLTLSAGKAPKASAATTQKQETSTSASRVKVTRITLNKSKLFLKKGKSGTIKATISPSKASNKTVKWSSSNNKIATVSSKGKVKGVKAGTVIITAKAADGSGVKAVCKVIVSSPSSSGSSGSGNKKSSSSTTSSSSATTAYTPTTWSSTTAAGKETTEAEEETTETGAWSFGGSDYKPEDANEVPQADGTLWDSDDFEDFNPEEGSTSDQESFNLKDQETADKSKGKFPIWLGILLGLGIAGGLTGLALAYTGKIGPKRKKKKPAKKKSAK